MGLFKSKEEIRLDSIIRSLEMNMSNNYKDNAQSDLRDFEELFAQLKDENRLKEKVIKKYDAIMDEYRQRMEGFTHKDQKPYWH